jgi:thiol-disulfide isomerase/thioredoxin
MDGDSLKISTFDGAHAFLFMAKVSDDNLKGIFYSGNHSMEPFIARRNEGFELPDENSLTFIKEGYDRLEFAFPTAEGELVSLADDRFQNKVVVVQIMGTWCPNCLDETKFLTNYLQERSNRELEIVALAFEYAPTTEEAFKGIQRLRDRIGVEYPILLAQYGTSNKEEANKKLPMLNHILSYPTTIFVDKKGMVRRIHTGFNGPATGEKFTQFKTDFNDFLSMLLNE